MEYVYNNNKIENCRPTVMKPNFAGGPPFSASSAYTSKHMNFKV